EDQVGLDIEVRPAGMALVLEDVQLIGAASNEAEGGGIIGQVDRLRLRAVDASQVDAELLIEEDEDVVIPRKRELLPRLVREEGVKLAGEAVVVPLVLISQQRIVDGEPVAGICGKGGAVVGVAGKAQQPASDIGERDRDRRALIEAGRIMVPL